MKKSEIMKKQAERAYVVESIIERVKSDLKYTLYEAVMDENGEYVKDENGDTVYALPDSQRDDITWDYNYLTKAEREEVYQDCIAHLERMLDKM